MGHADEDDETHACPHILPPGVHATPPVLPTALNKLGHVRFSPEDSGAPGSCPRQEVERQNANPDHSVPKPSSLRCICKEAWEGQPGRGAQGVQGP